MPTPATLPFDVNTFIANQSTLTPEQVAGIKELAAGYMRTEDYHRVSDERNRQVAQRIAAEDAYHNQLAQYERDASEALALKQDIERRFGSLDRFRATTNPDVLVTPSGDYVARSEVEQLTAKFEQTIGELRQNFNNFAEGTYHMVVKMPSYAEQYRSRYNESFDGKAFMDFLDQNHIVDPDIGYKLFTTEKESTFTKEQHAKEVKEAEERGARNFATTHHIPETAGARTAFRSPLMQPLKPVTPVTTTPASATTATSTTTAPVPVPARTSTPIDTANDNAVPLAQRMQADFMRVKDQP